jgi:hypothetical protein
MKVKQLKTLLADLPDNADIMLWNGFVGDVVPIASVQPIHLVKPTLELFRMRCLWEDRINPESEIGAEQEREIKDAYRSCTYEYNQFVPEERTKDGTYNTKRVFVIDAKVTGKSTFDRCGSISY